MFRELAVGGAEFTIDLGRSCEGVLLANDDADERWYGALWRGEMSVLMRCGVRVRLAGGL